MSRTNETPLEEAQRKWGEVTSGSGLAARSGKLQPPSRAPISPSRSTKRTKLKDQRGR